MAAARACLGADSLRWKWNFPPGFMCRRRANQIGNSGPFSVSGEQAVRLNRRTPGWRFAEVDKKDPDASLRGILS